MNKKIVSGLLAMSLVFNSGSYVFAADLASDGASGQTKLIKKVAAHYTITIPDVVEIPNSNVKTGKKIEIGVRQNSSFDQGDVAIVKIAQIQPADSGFIDGESCVKLKNGNSVIYSPLLLTKSSVAIDDKDLKDKAYEVNNATTLACFANDATTGWGKEAGLSSADYGLCAYRGYVGDDAGTIKRTEVADKAEELVSGTYEGSITFQLEVKPGSPVDIDKAGGVPITADRTYQ